MSVKTKESEHYDIETGERLNLKQLDNYLKIKSEKMLNALKKALKLRGSSITEEPKTNLQDNTPSGEKLILNKIQPIEGTPFHTAKKEITNTLS